MFCYLLAICFQLTKIVQSMILIIQDSDIKSYQKVTAENLVRRSTTGTKSQIFVHFQKNIHITYSMGIFIKVTESCTAIGPLCYTFFQRIDLYYFIIINSWAVNTKLHSNTRKIIYCFDKNLIFLIKSSKSYIQYLSLGGIVYNGTMAKAKNHHQTR